MIDHQIDSLCVAIQRPRRFHRRAPPVYPPQPSAVFQQHTLISPSQLPLVSGVGGSLVSGRIGNHHHNDLMEESGAEEKLQRTASEATALLTNQPKIHPNQPHKQHVAHTNESYLVNMTALMAHCSRSTTCQKRNDPQSRRTSTTSSSSSQSTSHTSVNTPASCDRRQIQVATHPIQYSRKISTLSQTKALMKIRSRRRQRTSLVEGDDHATSRHHLLQGPLNWSALELNLNNVNFIIVALCLLFTVHFLFPIVGAQRIHPGDHTLNGHDVKTIYTRRGSNVTIACEPASRTTKTYNLQWFKDDRKLVEVENTRLVVWQVGKHVSFIPETGALGMEHVEFEDSGDYLCVINNKRDNGLVRLFVQDVPDPPGQPFIMSFTSRSLNLSWAPSKNAHHSPVLNYIIHTRIGENGDWDSAGIATLTNRTEYTIDKLQPFTVYSFRVIAVNAIGASPPSKESYYTVTNRETPDGMPIGFRVVNKTASSLRLEWHPPQKSTIHGEFLGYRLRYRKNMNNADLLPEREITVSDPEGKNYTLRNLEPYTEYLVTLRVFNPAGDGPTATLAASTDEGVPSPPRNATIQRVNNQMARVQWSEPHLPNGRILGYHIYVHNVAANLTEMKKYQSPNFQQHTMEFSIHNLRPYTQYKVWIKAYTSRTEGEASRTLEFLTDVSGPSAPYIVNLTCEGDDALIVQWSRPEHFFSKIDYYFVYYRSEHDSDTDFEEIAINIPGYDMVLQHDTKITNLTKGTLYEVKVQGATRSMKESSKLYRGDFSEPRKVILQSWSSGSSAADLFGLNAPLMAGLICALLACSLALGSFLLWRKYFQAAYYYLDDPAVNTGSNPRASPNLSDVYIDESDYPAVPVTQWSKHVQDLHSDSDLGFSREYERLQRSTELHADRISSEHSHMAENKGKNRYVNIVAYDHTRVQLKPLPGQKRTGHDYINANYIDGYTKTQAYIGTQGPLPSTFDDYWRMIWEQRVCIIVMITNLTERGRRKCDMYWPKDGMETYGIVQVRLLQEVVMATYTLRTFHVKNLKIKKKHGNERTVYQYHYTNWPDHGVPEHPLPVLAFIRKSAAANPPNGGPIIVHCSAGVGRTGTYIVLDAMQRQIKHRGTINVFGFLKHIRQQRNFLVQTEEQYIFIHDAILEAIEAGDTEVPSTHLLRYLQTLQTGGEPKLADPGEKMHSSHWPMLERQFRMVTQFKAKDFNVVSALKPVNKQKNRSLNLIPLEAHRVHILPRVPGTDGSDYINATFLPGFSRLREFIITQHPVWDTIPDFWQMVWDHNVQTVVMCSSVINEKEYPQFWPDREDEADYGSFKVKLVDDSRVVLSEGGSFVSKRDLLLQSTQDDYEMTCRLVHSVDWPERQPLAHVFDLIKAVQDWATIDHQHLSTAAAADSIGPMVVMDNFGGTFAATFCILTTLYKQLNFEDCVDVYMYAKLYHLRRPGIWRSQDDYLFLYRALEALVSSSSNGAPPYHPPTTPLSGVGTTNVSNANTLTSTSSATHLMGNSTPPPLTNGGTGAIAGGGGGGTLGRNSAAAIERASSRNSSHSAHHLQNSMVVATGDHYQYANQVAIQQQQHHTLQHPHHHHHHHLDRLSNHSGSDMASGTTGSTHLGGGTNASSHHRTPSPYMCDSPQQLLSIQTTTGVAGTNQYHISMIPAAESAGLHLH